MGKYPSFFSYSTSYNIKNEWFSKIWNNLLKHKNPNNLDYFFCKKLSTLFEIVVLGTAPITVSFLSPLEKIIMVGTPLTPYWVAIEGLSSVFSLKHSSLPLYSYANSPMTGWSIRHGPHHDAQNSTTTGTSAFRTSDSHVASVTEGTAGNKLIRNYTYNVHLRTVS